jgi:hypothetical protein
MTPHVPLFRSRRDFLRLGGAGFGSLAFASLLQADERKADSPFTPKKPHHEAKAKAVIFLFMEGGPSHVDLFDPKPELTRQHGNPLPASFGKVITPMGTGGNKLLASKRKFAKHGKAGIAVSDWMPHLAKQADDLCVLRACWADGLNHVGSVCQMNTGSILAGRPSLGTWALYGLGTENQNLPGFVVMTEGAGEVFGGARNWGTGFMPPTYQGTVFRNGPNPLLNLATPKEVGEGRQRDKLELIGKLNDIHKRDRPGDANLDARQSAYELAFRMQAEAPDAVDLSKEDAKTKELYGLNRKETAEFGHRCLLARRLVERGVRFVQVSHAPVQPWDSHDDLKDNHTRLAKEIDGPIAALISDLKRLGMFEETLIVWGGEFGRTPVVELPAAGSNAGKINGRDHNHWGFSVWLAGGGVKKGVVHGATDDLGFHAVEDRHYVTDLHATVLHLLGLDPRKLAVPGRKRLEIDYGKPMDAILA